VAFRRILDELLIATPGSIAALFLDYEGETVELLSQHELETHDLKIIGAYQGIFLSRLRDICTTLDAGRPERFKIEFARVKILSFDLTDGYYVVLLLESTANEGMAWHQLGACRGKLLAEM
jgi:predicted regulator of Ras-like GTPase activity (Roadblock/LC7/MglB family)